MNVLLTHWTRPRRAAGSAYTLDWPTRAHALAAWALSVTLAARNVGPVTILTDASGAADLAPLGLPARIVTVLDGLDETAVEPRIWAAGKLAAYAAQREPYVHIDADVFLTQPLPQLGDAPVTVQGVEWLQQAAYGPVYDRALGVIERLPDLPTGWEAERGTPRASRPAYNMGILACATPEAVRAVADAARASLALLARADVQAATAAIPASNVCVVVEQYAIAAALRRAGVPVAVLLRDQPWSTEGQDQANAIGYVHLMGDAKRSPVALRRLMRRCAAECPDAFNTLTRLTS